MARTIHFFFFPSFFLLYVQPFEDLSTPGRPAHTRSSLVTLVIYPQQIEKQSSYCTPTIKKKKKKVCVYVCVCESELGREVEMHSRK